MATTSTVTQWTSSPKAPIATGPSSPGPRRPRGGVEGEPLDRLPGHRLGGARGAGDPPEIEAVAGDGSGGEVHESGAVRRPGGEGAQAAGREHPRRAQALAVEAGHLELGALPACGADHGERAPARRQVRLAAVVADGGERVTLLERRPLQPELGPDVLLRVDGVPGEDHPAPRQWDRLDVTTGVAMRCRPAPPRRARGGTQGTAPHRQVDAEPVLGRVVAVPERAVLPHPRMERPGIVLQRATA